MNQQEYPPLNLQIIFSTLFATIVFLMTSQAMEIDRYLKFTLVYILTTIVADGFGLTVGAMFDPIVSRLYSRICGNIYFFYRFFLCVIRMEHLLRPSCLHSNLHFAVFWRSAVTLRSRSVIVCTCRR